PPAGQAPIEEKALPPAPGPNKRSFYLLSRRASNLSLLTVSDQPLVAVNCPCRDASAVPLQSLTMLNGAFVEEQAKNFADRVSRIAGVSGDGAARAAFRLALAP